MGGVKTHYHDFEPVRVRVKVIDNNGLVVLTNPTKTVLASPYIGHKVFTSYLAGLMPECAMTLTLFVIQPTESEEPFHRAQKQDKLFECGFTGGDQEICVV